MLELNLEERESAIERIRGAQSLVREKRESAINRIRGAQSLVREKLALIERLALPPPPPNKAHNLQKGPHNLRKEARDLSDAASRKDGGRKGFVEGRTAAAGERVVLSDKWQVVNAGCEALNSEP
ncbi:hypothetical protein T484DRAFT_1801567 [Baffinella frigidus]|nr:hypothetical protein T484DRAFT_1801567 [Cryptophyta sp. CCMP2293]